MKKIMLATIASVVFGSSILSAAATGIYVWRIATFSSKHYSCEKDGQWDYVRKPENVTYNSMTGKYITKSCHTGNEAYVDVIVFGRDIRKNATVGLGMDLDLYKIEQGDGYQIHRFHRKEDGRTASGGVYTFISAKYTTLADTSIFARFPTVWEAK